MIEGQGSIILVYILAWLAVVLGINSTRNAGNFTRLRLVKITFCIACAINP